MERLRETGTRCAFGVDLGGTTIKLGLFDAERGLVTKGEIPTRSEGAGRHLLDDIASAIADEMSAHDITAKDVAGIGLGVPGAVLNGSYVDPCVNLGGWGGFDVAAALQARTELSVRVVNDANAAALGEMGAGGAKGYRNVVFVTLGTGVGGGIIVDGKLVAGARGSGGEIGHIKIANSTDGRRCGCGKRGCLERYASATGLVESAQEAMADASIDTALRSCEPLTCKGVFDCAQAGDAVALGLVDAMADALGRALASISCVVDPDVIVIGGGVSRAGDFLLDRVRTCFARAAFPAAEGTPIVAAHLGNDAGIYGAAQLVLG